jgi:hypothetical protein
MKWQVEYIGSQANILISDSEKSVMDLDPVGMGFPIALAERIVKLHNEALTSMQERLSGELKGDEL